MKTCFLTGVTGALGSEIAFTILQLDVEQVWLLIRAEDRPLLQKRFAMLKDFWATRYAALAGWDERVTLVHGDVRLPKFGMEAGQYRRLRERCDTIIHSAGAVRLNLPYEQARAVALGSARNVGELGRQCADRGILKKIEFVSTVGVGGRISGQVPEAWIRMSRVFHNTYEEAKAEAEDYIETEVSAGLPITVHRPSMIVGASGSGHILRFQIFYYLCDFLAGLVTRGLLPDLGHHRLDTVPVDFVARAIVKSASTPELAGSILHLCSGPEDSVSLRALSALVREKLEARGVELPRIHELPVPIYRIGVALLSYVMGEKGAKTLRPVSVYLSYLAEDQSFANRRSRDTLFALGVRAPDPNEYLDSVVEYYLDSSRCREEAKGFMSHRRRK